MGEFHESADVILRPTTLLIVEKDLSWREAGDGLAVVLLKSVVWELKALLGAVGPQVAVHASMDRFSILIKTSSPGVVPESTPVVLLLVADDFRDFNSLLLQFDEVEERGTAGRTGADHTNARFTRGSHSRFKKVRLRKWFLRKFFFLEVSV